MLYKHIMFNENCIHLIQVIYYFHIDSTWKTLH